MALADRQRPGKRCLCEKVDRIAAVGPADEVTIPEGAEVLELGGHTVIPGLVGLHNHTFYTSPGANYSHMVFTAPRLLPRERRDDDPHHRHGDGV